MPAKNAPNLSRDEIDRILAEVESATGRRKEKPAAAARGRRVEE